MKFTRLSVALFAGFLFAALLPLRAGSSKNSDVIEHFSTFDAAKARIDAEVKVTASGSVMRSVGASMGIPTDYLACQVNDFAHAKVGQRVCYVSKALWANEPTNPVRPHGWEAINACHRVVWIEKDGTLAVQGDRWPWKTEYVTPKNYLGTVTIMAVWDKK